MFSIGHLIWIAICTVLIAVLLWTFKRRQVPLRRVFVFALAFSVLSEIVKVLSLIEIVPMVDQVIVQENGAPALDWTPIGQYTPYLRAEHLPLELCSLFLFFLAAALLVKDEKWKNRLYAVMFATGTIGGVMGIVLCTSADRLNAAGAFFTSVRSWQFFLYHAMVVAVSLYIGLCGESGLVFSDWKKAVLCIIALDLPTFYLNSVLSSAVYVHDELVGVTHRINFFSSYVNPLGLVLTEKWQWLVYLLVRLLLACALIIGLFLLLPRRRKGAE